MINKNKIGKNRIYKNRIDKNKKGFIFTLDLIVGMVVIFSVIFVSLFFVSRGSEIGISEHHLLRVGSDIISIMDEEKVFDSLDHLTIEDKMRELLPANSEMLIRVEGNFSTANGTIEVGDDLPQQRFTISGKRVALTDDDIYLKITYFVWARKQE
ncbi:MAG: hypothetical protein ABH824_02610 [Nanoarchaeota archaeon]|nr:hypothetical protein [Nanoarchaeota archaeon]MBU1632126.1 hypothetical protein [Nanoarchaeota archaeon]MBU1876191.1 hypothetical protein [Nanoarchaeota archaeon]